MKRTHQHLFLGTLAFTLSLGLLGFFRPDLTLAQSTGGSAGGGGADNLGNHIATTVLNMDGNNIQSTGTPFNVNGVAGVFRTSEVGDGNMNIYNQTDGSLIIGTTPSSPGAGNILINPGNQSDAYINIPSAGQELIINGDGGPGAVRVDGGINPFTNAGDQQIGTASYPWQSFHGMDNSRYVYSLGNPGAITFAVGVDTNTGDMTLGNEFSSAAVQIHDLMRLNPSNVTALRTQNFQDRDGTIALLGDIPTNLGSTVHGALSISPETTNNLAIADTYYQITGWTTGVSENVTLSTSNIVVSSLTSYFVYHDISFSGDNSKTIQSAIFVNGTNVAPGKFRRKLGTGGDVGAAPGGTILDLAPGDVVDVRLLCIADTAVINIERGDFVVFAIGSGGGGSGFAWTLPPPAATNTVGDPGDISYSSTHFYVCIGTNSWRRTSLATWE